MDIQTITDALPPSWQVDVIEPKSAIGLVDPNQALAWTLAKPLGEPPLNELIGPGDQVCLALSGSIPTDLIPQLTHPLLRELEQAGVRQQDITLLCGNDAPPQPSPPSPTPRLDLDVPGRYRVIEHNPNDVVPLGTVLNVPLTVNLAAVEPDLLVAAGVVEPHPYAGYSGGSDGVALGCTGERTVEALHSPPFVNSPRVAWGQVTDNPFQNALRATARRVGLRFVLNGVLDPSGQMIDVCAGEPEAVHDKLVSVAQRVYQSSLASEYDLIIAQAPSPWSADLYGLAKVVTRLGFSTRSPLHPDGALIVIPSPAPPPGPSLPVERFFATLSSSPSPDVLLERLAEHCCQPGESLAYRLAHLLDQHEIVVVGSDYPELVTACHMRPSPDLTEAVDHLSWRFPEQARALVVPQAAHTVLSLQSEWQLSPLDY